MAPHWGWLLLLLLAWPAVGLGLFLLCHGGLLRRLWREPVLKFPILIIESDDWGAGPMEQVEALRRLRELLARYRDASGRAPVATLAVILAVPDRAGIRDSGGASYARLTLAEPLFEPLRQAIDAGVTAGVFAVQLHGLEHCRPDSLVQAMSEDARVREWMQEDGVPRMEDLPAPLQSAWIDAARLPSWDLSKSEVHSRVAQEIALYRELFGRPPRVAVPTTFIWTPEVERAWSAAGVRFLITPGRYLDHRDAQGRPAGPGTRIFNGEAGQGDVAYLVRDQYFEPSMGHTAEDGVAALRGQSAQGRPTLLEMHRWNFIADLESAAQSVRELDRLLAEALRRFPHLRFTTSRELAEAMARRDPAWCERSWAPRLLACSRRLRSLWELRSWMWLGGLMPLLAGLESALRRQYTAAGGEVHAQAE